MKSTNVYQRVFHCHCSMVFDKLEQFKRHKRKHAGEKPYYNCAATPVPDLIKRKTKKRVVIKPLTQMNSDEIMDDLFSLSDLSSDEEDLEEEEEEEKTMTRCSLNVSLLHLADYLINNPDEPPENFLLQHYHRLSLGDLYNPVHKLGQQCSAQKYNGEVYVTLDEFEALQGFSRFSEN